MYIAFAIVWIRDTPPQSLFVKDLVPSPRGLWKVVELLKGDDSGRTLGNGYALEEIASTLPLTLLLANEMRASSTIPSHHDLLSQ
jgi:hypothetical protein